MVEECRVGCNNLNLHRWSTFARRLLLLEVKRLLKALAFLWERQHLQNVFPFMGCKAFTNTLSIIILRDIYQKTPIFLYASQVPYNFTYIFFSIAFWLDTH